MNRNDNLLGYVAELYYDRGLSQQEIGSIIGASRPTVSRLIDEAKKQGIVRIIIETSVRKNNKLSSRLRKAFDLRDAIVVNAAYDFDKSIDVCGKAVAALLPAYLEAGMTVGISWGRTINAVINAIGEDDFSDINVAQTVGCMTMGNPTVDGFSAAQRLAYKLRGTYSSINAPLFVQGKEVYNYLINEPMIRDTLENAAKVDVLINGVGSFFEPKTSIRQSGYFNSYNLDRYEEEGAIASFMGRFIDADGKEVSVDDFHIIATPLDTAIKVPLSIVLNATGDNALSTLAVLKGGYADILVVDEPLANNLLELVKK